MFLLNDLWLCLCIDFLFFLVEDLPIARRSSLHRFLEKRKDRYASFIPISLS